VVNLVESGGADLPTQAELFVPGGRIFHELTALSALGVPTVALVFGNSTAGGAYVPGMCDHAVLVDRRAKVFLGGPPLVRMATGEESDDESLGGAEMHSRVSGLSDYFAVDEHDAIRIGRRILARINWRKLGPPPAATRAAALRPRRGARDRPGRREDAPSTPARCWPARSTAPTSTSTSRSTAPRWSRRGRASTAIRWACWPTTAA
jgi:acetyl-CoA carboxylase carboxyltransferase component